MSAFHRIDDVRTMPALRFINFAIRLPAYKGIVRFLVEAANRDETPIPTTAAPASRLVTGGDVRQNRHVESTEQALLTDPALAGLFEKGGANG